MEARNRRRHVSLAPLRKYSFPLASESLQLAGTELADRRIRRFSNVSDAVSRKLSTTLGWPKTTKHEHNASNVSTAEIVNQGRSLCGQFIRSKLKRAGVLHRKLGLQRLRSTRHFGDGNASHKRVSADTLNRVYAQLHNIGLELERQQPKLYSGVVRHIAIRISSEMVVQNALSAIGHELFRLDVTWAKIAALYCVAGGLAVDCVRHGHPEYVFGLVDALAGVLERDAAVWMAAQGGWPALLTRYRGPSDDHRVFQMIALSVVCLILLLVLIVFLIRCLGRFAFTMTNRIRFRPNDFNENNG